MKRTTAIIRRSEPQGKQARSSLQMLPCTMRPFRHIRRWRWFWKTMSKHSGPHKTSLRLNLFRALRWRKRNSSTPISRLRRSLRRTPFWLKRQTYKGSWTKPTGFGLEAVQLRERVLSLRNHPDLLRLSDLEAEMVVQQTEVARLVGVRGLSGALCRRCSRST